jgi:hypothetical protein
MHPNTFDFPDYFKKDEMCRAFGLYRRNRNAYRLLTEKPERKRPPGRSVHKFNSKMDLKETEHEGVDWIHLAHDRSVLSTMTTLGFDK